jgi:hypothetical protein
MAVLANVFLLAEQSTFKREVLDKTLLSIFHLYTGVGRNYVYKRTADFTSVHIFSNVLLPGIKPG